MAGVFSGFATIGVLIALGILLAHLRIIDLAGQRTLSTLAFYVASPALLLTVLEDSDPAEVFSTTLVASAAAVLVVVLLHLGLSRLRGPLDLGGATVGAMAAGYVNAGNLGVPIAAYVLGDVALVAPILLMQLLVLQPLALTLLDVAVAPTRLSLRKVLSRPATNPLTIASAAGVALALSGVRLPAAVHDPLDLVGGMAVPAMLIAYGVALRLGPLPGRGVPASELGLAVGLKLVAQPLAAYAVGRWALGLEADALLAVTVLSALPTAQNVFVIASRYGRAELLARDAIFVSTLASVPAVVLITALIA